MYTISADGLIFHDPFINDPDVTCVGDSVELTTEINKAGSLKFLIGPNNVAYYSLRKLKTEIVVDQDGTEVWRGRVLDSEKDFYRLMTVTCEGILNYLMDSMIRPKTFTGTLAEVCQDIIDEHNAGVQASKQFTLSVRGDATEDFELQVDDYTATLDLLMDEIIDKKEAYIEAEYQNGRNILYIDFRDETARRLDQTIEFGENLLDLVEYVDSSEVFTVLIPTGDDGLTIEEVNDGKDYLESAEGIAEFGRITRTEKFDGITDAEELKTVAQQFLDEGANLKVNLTVNALDLRFLNVDISKLRMGYQNQVRSLPHNLDAWFTCSKVTENLLDPAKNEYTFGYEFTTLSESQAAAQKAASKFYRETILDRVPVTRKVNDKALNKDIYLDSEDVGAVSKSDGIVNITREGLIFTATRGDGTSFTFTQRDNNTTYSAGNGLTLDSTTFNLAAHAVNANTYGLGTTGVYGHVKTVNNLTTSAHADGLALSAYQGYLLQQNKAEKSEAISNITRSGTTFTATRADGTTFTFTQQDNNTTYSAGSGLNLSGTTFSLAAHAVNANTYGLGTTGVYGHVKTVNNLTTSAHADGLALSAYQGYLLQQNKASIRNPTLYFNIGNNDDDPATTYPHVELRRAGNATEGFSLQLVYYSSSSSNAFYPLIDKSGDRTWVLKSGDTMTGALVVTNNSGLYADDTVITIGTTPSSNHYSNGYFLRDNAKTIIGYFRGIYLTNNRSGAQMEARRIVDGTAKYNTLSLLLDASGNPYVQVTSSVAWRNALEAVWTKDVFYSVGDSISGLHSCEGVLTHDRENLHLWFNTYKMLPSGRNLSISSIKAELMISPGGHIPFNNDMTTELKSYITSTSRYADGSVHVVLTNSSKWKIDGTTTATNNNPFNGVINITATVV